MYLSTRHLMDKNFKASCYIYVASMGLKITISVWLVCSTAISMVSWQFCPLYVMSGYDLNTSVNRRTRCPQSPFFYRIVYVYLEYHFSFHNMFLFSTKHNLTSEIIKYTTTKVENLLYNLNVLELVVTESFLSLNLFKVL